MSRLPPGPRGGVVFAPLVALRRDPVAFFLRLQRDYGPHVHFRLGLRHVFVLNDPEAVRQVFVAHERSFRRGPVLRRAGALLGNGLLTSEGAFHLRQRRLAQPAFHRERLERYGEQMIAEAEEAASAFPEGRPFDVAEAMLRLTLSTVGRALFAVDVRRDAAEVGRALEDAFALFDKLVLPFSEVLLWSPLPSAVRFRRARDRLRATIDRLIAERREEAQDRGDLLSLLLAARDEDGQPMSDEQLRDEVLSLFLAGHETTAIALTWALHLLALSPEVEARLHAEVHEVLGDRPLRAADYPRLTWCNAVFAESLRLYPPAWVLGRQALEGVEICGYAVPRGSVVVLSPYVVHRDPRWFPDPERFDPSRWLGEARPSRPRHAWFPFGAGTRQCIGEGFAWMEGTLALAAIARRWSLRHARGPEVPVRALITLRPRDGLWMVAERRPTGA